MKTAKDAKARIVGEGKIRRIDVMRTMNGLVRETNATEMDANE